MGYKVLAINPGSTSTKVALYDEERPLLDLTLRHTTEELTRFTDIIDQLDWRRGLILSALREKSFDIKELSAVIGRGGLIRPIPAGVYEVNSRMRYDLRNAQMKHACNLGGLLAAQIAHMAGVKAYIADPPVVDEMDDVARITGMPMCPRKSVFHALNQKATARLHCERTGLVYEESNLIVAHMGGGISVGAHRQGK
ncbi:butyrate kinase, partial [human gut metagenome]